MLSRSLIITFYDTYAELLADGLKRPVALEFLHVSQSTTGYNPVYLEVEQPKMSYTLYSSPVENDLVYHVVSIDGVAPVDNDDIYNKIFAVVGA